ncbi:urease subunit beta [Mycobacterium malmoense]|nr:urease subunit beta [Mycobacterium malmoense]OCB29737.1 urease subunit beta [Mycobacterium malmoense]
MIPGEILYGSGDIDINANAELAWGRWTWLPTCTGRSPVFMICISMRSALAFDRAAAHGYRLDIAAATAVRFEPGVPHTVRLVPLRGRREVHGLTLDPPGRLDA